MAFVTALILKHFDRTCPVILETHASDFAIETMRGHSTPSYSIVESLSERKYGIYNKEMPDAIVDMNKHRHYFEGLGHKSTGSQESSMIKRNQYLQCSLSLMGRKNSHFNFVIIFRPGKQSGKLDALSCRPEYFSGPDSQPTFLKPDQVKISEAIGLSVAVLVLTYDSVRPNPFAWTCYL